MTWRGAGASTSSLREPGQSGQQRGRDAVGWGQAGLHLSGISPPAGWVALGEFLISPTLDSDLSGGDINPSLPGHYED